MLEWVTTKKGLPEVIVRAVMSFIMGQKQKFKWDLGNLKNSWYKLVDIKDLCCRHCF